MNKMEGSEGMLMEGSVNKMFAMFTFIHSTFTAV